MDLGSAQVVEIPGGYPGPSLYVDVHDQVEVMLDHGVHVTHEMAPLIVARRPAPTTDDMISMAMSKYITERR